MASSKRYRQLRRCIRTLRRTLLPAKFSPTGVYRGAERVRLRAMAFRVLVHGEIEEFIEDRAFELFDAAWKAWTQQKVPSRAMLGLLAFGGFATEVPPEKLGGSNRQKAYESLEEPIQKAQAAWRLVHKRNHGIKEENVLALLLPLGIAAEKIDGMLLADLNSYGAKRGEVAHRSAVGLAQYTDPRTEYADAERLIGALNSIDELVDDSLKELRAMARRTRRRTSGTGGTAALTGDDSPTGVRVRQSA